jgi:3-deoxy-D-manno-octulosonic-acid transferase
MLAAWHARAMTEAASAPPALAPLTLAERAYHRLAPLAFVLVHLAARLGGTPADALRQRRGFLPAVGDPCLWLHGASAGEMAAASNLVALLRAHGHRFAAAYTSTNAAGLALIQTRLAAGDVSALAPWDAPAWVDRALDRWRPAALCLIETELWPVLIHAATRRGVPVLSVSARIYRRDVARYRLVRGVMAPTLRRLTAVLLQSEAERARFAALGAPLERCAVAGNLKHLAPPADATAFRLAVGLDGGERVVVVGSLHADEVTFLVAALACLPAPWPRLIVAPRHPPALVAFEHAAARRGWSTARRGAPRSGARVLLLDSVGELRAAYAGAALALVGGSIGAHGGHDLVEPVRAGAPVLFGPHTAHVEPEARALRAAVPESLVRTPQELAGRIGAWLDDEDLRLSALQRQRAVLPDPGVIAARYLTALAAWLQRVPR